MYNGSAKGGRKRQGRRGGGRNSLRGRAAKQVETDGRGGEEGRREGPDQSNVVPFPRDWIGPRDELVPVGPGAEDRAPEPEASVLELPREVPPTAADFWGEDAAAIHDPVERPDLREIDGAPAASSSSRRRQHGSAPTIPRGAIPRRFSWRPRVRVAASPVPRRLAPWVAALGAVVVVAGSLAGLQSAPPQSRASRPSTPIAAAIGRGEQHRVANAAHRVARARPKPPHRAARPLTRHASRSVTPAVSPPAQSAAPVSSYTPAAYTQPTDTYTTPPSASGAGGAAPSHSSSGSSSGGGQTTPPPAGPVGAGAPFGPGHLG
jgi:hypothetical protein